MKRNSASKKKPKSPHQQNPPQNEDSDILENDTSLYKDASSSEEEEETRSFNFASKLADLLEQLQSSKSAPDRFRHYGTLIRTLTSRFACDHLQNCQLDVQKILVQSFRSSSNNAETSVAAEVACIFFTTMGQNDASLSLLEAIFNHLQRLFADKNNVEESVRSQCAKALVIGCLVADADFEEVVDPLIKSLIKVVFNSRSRSIRIRPQQDTSSFANLRSTCLRLYSLLLSMQSSEYILEVFEKNIASLISCLNADVEDVDDDDNGKVSIAASECIALLTERCRQADEYWEPEEMPPLCDRLQRLISLNGHHQSKETLRRLRRHYRLVLHTLQGGDFAVETIKFGREVLQIDSWKCKLHYETIAGVLGTGTNFHLAQNMWLRTELFDLGPPVVAEVVIKKKSSVARHLEKVQKQLGFAHERKERQTRRSKLRGKRVQFEAESYYA